MILMICLSIFILYLSVGFIIFWWGTRTPSPGSRSLVRTCGNRIGFINKRIPAGLHFRASHEPWDQSDRMNFNVILVLDHSVSMSSGPGSALEHAKKAAISFVDNVISESCQIGVVQFDTMGEIIQPVSNDRIKVIDKIRSIKRRGGTDISEGLTKADEALREKSDSKMKRQDIVILLSDGGSDRNSAVMAADVLKGRNVRIVCVGLGRYLDENTLKEIASSPEDYYQTLNKEDLTGIYNIIGQSIDDIRGRTVEIKEYVNNTVFVLSSTGDVPPQTMDFNKGYVNWFQPYVHKKPKEIPYQIIPLRWGWHSVAKHRAQMEYKDNKGLAQTAESNKSPHILILPQFGWMLWVVLFNPLFWMLMGWMHRSKGPVINCKEVIPPEPIPLPELLPVQAAPRIPREVSYPDTLFVGIGYSGILMLRAIRRYQETFPFAFKGSWQFLGIDTGSSQKEPESFQELIGPELNHNDVVQMPDNLEPVLRKLETRDIIPDEWNWLDIKRERQTLKPSDLDLIDGTRGKRVLGKTALYNHLKKDNCFEDIPLIEAIDKRICEGGENTQLIVVGNISGGTAGGQMTDILMLLKKRATALNQRFRSMDAVWLTHTSFKPSDQAAALQSRNAFSFVSEYSRLAYRNDLPIPYRQAASESDSHIQVSRFIDHTLVIEKSLSSTGQGESCPVESILTGANAIIQFLAVPEGGAALNIDQRTSDIKTLSQRVGETIAFGIGSSFLGLPIQQIHQYLRSRTVFECLGLDLMLLEETPSGIVPVRTPEFDKIVSDHLELVFSGNGLNRNPPAFFTSLLQLKDGETATGEMNRILAKRMCFPNSDIDISKDSDELCAHVLDEQQQYLIFLLEEWSLFVLNGPRDDQGQFDVRRRRGAFYRLICAVERLHHYSRDALHYIEEMRESVEKQGILRRYEFAQWLFLRYHQVIEGFYKHLEGWRLILDPEADDPEHGNPNIIGKAIRRAARAREALEVLAKGLPGSVIWSEEMADSLSERFIKPVRDKILLQVNWVASEVSATEPLRIGFRIQGAGNVVLSEHWNAGEETLSLLETIADSLGLENVLDLSILDYVSIPGWLKSKREDPVIFDMSSHLALSNEPVVRKEYLYVHSDMDVSMDAGDVEKVVTGDPYRCSVLRLLSPCAAFSLQAVQDYHRFNPEDMRSALPFLDPVDRSAAEFEDRFQSFGMNKPVLSPVIRSYFRDKDMLKAFITAMLRNDIRAVTGINQMVMTFEGMTLSDENRSRGTAILIQAMDQFIVKQAAWGGDPKLDRESILKKYDLFWKNSERMEMDEAINHLKNAPSPDIWNLAPTVLHHDIVQLSQLFLEIETRRRERQSKGGRL